MGKTILRLIFRKMRGHLPQLIGMALLVLVGTAFFVTLYTIYLSYDGHAEKFFESQGYADVTYYGRFDDGDVKYVTQQKDIKAAQGRSVKDYKDGDVTLRVISLSHGINEPYIYEGSYPQNDGECLLIKKHAEAKDIGIGGTLTVDGRSLRVTGIAGSPEYVYLVENERAMMAQSDRFGVVFVPRSFFGEGYNEIVVSGDVTKEAAGDMGEQLGAQRTVVQADQLNHTLYHEDLDQIRTFAYVFPFVFALLIVMIIYVMLKRAVAMESRQIGIYKALGMQGGTILLIYMAQAGFMAFIGAVLGCVAASLLCDTIIGFFSTMFEVPGLTFVFYPGLWLGIIAVCTAVCMGSALLSVRSVLKPLPAYLMRPKMPSGGKQIMLEKAPAFWKRLSFNTRYALKSTLRNKGRFLAVMLGICGSCALLTFAFGFFNSAEHTQTAYFNDFARYDALIEFEPIPLEAEHPASKSLDSINKALVTPVTVDDKEYRLYVVEDDFDMQAVDTKSLENGVVIPEYFSEEWNVREGDTLEIDGVDVKIAGLSAQSFGLSLYTSYAYAERVFSDFPPVYNVIFARDSDMGDLETLSRDYGFEYSTLEDDKASFASVMESLNTLIWFMLACAVILGLTVLYSVGLMNLSAREYEYMFMGVMGYSLKSIMFAHVKETVLQLIPAIPAGFLLGNALLGAVKTEFSGDSFVLSAAIFPQSYLITGVIVIVMAAFIAFLSGRRIGRLDIVEGLKIRDE